MPWALLLCAGVAKGRAGVRAAQVVYAAGTVATAPCAVAAWPPPVGYLPSCACCLDFPLTSDGFCFPGPMSSLLSIVLDSQLQPASVCRGTSLEGDGDHALGLLVNVFASGGGLGFWFPSAHCHKTLVCIHKLKYANT